MTTWLDTIAPDLDVRPMPKHGAHILGTATTGETVDMPVETVSLQYSLRMKGSVLDEALPYALGGGVRQEAIERSADTVFVSPIERRELGSTDPLTGEIVKWGQAYCYVAFGVLKEAQSS